MSSAILYIAIVAIWATVLMPRWLKPRASAPVPAGTDGQYDSGGADTIDEAPEFAAPEPPPVTHGYELPDYQRAPEPEPDHVAATWARPAAPAAPAQAHEPVAPPAPARVREPAAAPRRAAARASAPWRPSSRVVHARRRMLGTILALTAIATVLAVTGVTQPWVAAPPAGILAGFLFLLRAAAHTDARRAAEHVQRARAARQATTRRAAPPEAAPAPAPAAPAPALDETMPPGTIEPVAAYDTGPVAQIIDLSARIADQLYDQYEDAAHRAVGD